MESNKNEYNMGIDILIMDEPNEKKNKLAKSLVDFAKSKGCVADFYLNGHTYVVRTRLIGLRHLGQIIREGQRTAKAMSGYVSYKITTTDEWWL